MAQTPALAGVGCESCHGPGGTYTQDGYMTLKNKEYKRSELVAVGMTVPSAETCKRCHNANSPTGPGSIDYEAEGGLLQGTHEHIALRFNHDG